MLMQLDATPFDSDFDDIFKLFDAMRVFAKANPEHEFLPTDDPGANHETPRVPRIGWSAFRPIKPEEADDYELGFRKNWERQTFGQRGDRP